MHLDEREHFIIEDIDETHVFVESGCVGRLKHELDQLLEANTYQIEEKPS
jgi:hypothetical protein